jgi:2-phosphosulfolactate phosphatase
MRIDVAPLPAALPLPPRDVCVVVDVLRATSTIATLLAAGVREVEVVGSVAEAIARREALDAAFACGEVGGLPPEGFDYGNSPAEFAPLSMAGQRAVLFTSNGTKALLHVADAPAVFSGSLLNAEAVVAAAVDAALGRDTGMIVVCAGTTLGTAFALEDFFCAGALVEHAVRRLGTTAELGDGARAAERVYEGFARDARAAFSAAEHGRALIPLGLAADLDFCAHMNTYPVVPVARREGERVVVRAAI